MHPNGASNEWSSGRGGDFDSSLMLRWLSTGPCNTARASSRAIAAEAGRSVAFPLNVTPRPRPLSAQFRIFEALPRAPGSCPAFHSWFSLKALTTRRQVEDLPSLGKQVFYVIRRALGKAHYHNRRGSLQKGAELCLPR